jgi:hypothetical protein
MTKKIKEYNFIFEIKGDYYMTASAAIALATLYIYYNIKCYSLKYTK